VIEDDKGPGGNRFRTASGGRIDRSQPVRFTFDGRAYQGYAGDTLASALLANGVHLVGRSFKYHRPRGIVAAGPEEPNALVTVRRDWRRTTPNLRATEVEIHDGLDAVSQNRFPSLRFDFGALNDRLSPLFPAGFYYKTFMGPERFGRGASGAWARIYEPVIRRMAGLGRAPVDGDTDSYASRHAHCDVLVVGAGPAGLAAALAAAEGGARVMLADEQAEAGGSLLGAPDVMIGGEPAADWREGALARLMSFETVTVLTRTTVFGAYPDHLFGLVERLTDHLPDQGRGVPRERLWQVRARHVVLATGALERPLVFPGNDRPGVMLAGAAATYLHRYGVLVGTRSVVVTTTDSGYRIAADLAEHGVRIEAIADLRGRAGEAAEAAARAAGIPIHGGVSVLGTGGRLRVSSIRLALRDGRRERLEADSVLMSGGRSPTLHLFSQLRGRLVWDARHHAFLAQDPLGGVSLAGAATGLVEAPVDDAFESGTAAGVQALAALGMSGVGTVALGASMQSLPPADSVVPVAPVARHLEAASFIDFQNDVTAKDLRLAAQEGFRSIEHIKRYTTTGMATDQGKTSNVNALSHVSGVLGRPVGDIGHTTFRAPYTPVTFGALAAECRGTLFDPVRLTPIDPAARERGAIFEAVGPWQRARYFPKPGETMHQAVARECLAVRTSVGVFDASTLGKIEVVGPDAATFLDRMYVNAIASLPVGRSRYAILLNEAGFVIDDGIVSRLSDVRFHVTTTTTGAARVLAHMEDYLQTEFPELRCWLTSVTEQWAVVAVQGPRARAVLAPLVEDVDLAPDVLVHMAQTEGRVLGVPARVFRVSFTGELGYEINVPAGYGRAVWSALLSAAERVGGTAYGTEAMHVLRAEKGYIIVGQDSDGTLTPRDLGLPVGERKADFVGKRSLSRSDMLVTDRPQLVGLETEDGRVVLEEGAQITRDSAPAVGTHAVGHVTSAYHSAVLGRSIALAVIEGGRAHLGETFHVPMPSGVIRVKVVSPAFYDPKGGRLHG